jgi:hypothetical protein
MSTDRIGPGPRTAYTPQGNVTALVADNYPKVIELKGLDDLFDQEKVDKIMQETVFEIKKVVGEILEQMRDACPGDYAVIYKISEAEKVDIHQIAAEYIAQEAFFSMVVDKLRLYEGILDPESLEGALALTHHHSLVSITPSDGKFDDLGDAIHPKVTYSRLDSRKTSGDWQNDETTVACADVSLDETIMQGACCHLPGVVKKTSPLKLLRLIPSTVSAEVCEQITTSVLTAMGSSTLTRE